MDHRRIFAAIDVSDSVRTAIAAYVGDLKRQHPGLKVRWERPEKYHITLRFEPKAGDELLDRVAALIEETAAAVPPFELTIAGTGEFSRRRGPAVLWIGAGCMPDTEGGDPLRSVAERLNGFEGQRGRAFHPHITIARIKDAGACSRLIEAHRSAAFAALPSAVDHITLYESILGPQGSDYHQLMKQPLRGLTK